MVKKMKHMVLVLVHHIGYWDEYWFEVVVSAQTVGLLGYQEFLHVQ